MTKLTVVSNYEEVECRFCGRRYDDLTEAELSRMTRTGPCPSDDCPGHEDGGDADARSSR